MHILKNIIKTSDTSNLWCKLKMKKTSKELQQQQKIRRKKNQRCCIRRMENISIWNVLRNLLIFYVKKIAAVWKIKCQLHKVIELNANDKRVFSYSSTSLHHLNVHVNSYVYVCMCECVYVFLPIVCSYVSAVNDVRWWFFSCIKCFFSLCFVCGCVRACVNGGFLLYFGIWKIRKRMSLLVVIVLILFHTCTSKTAVLFGFLFKRKLNNLKHLA